MEQQHDLLSTAAAAIAVVNTPVVAPPAPASSVETVPTDAATPLKVKKIRGKRTEYKSITIDKKLEMVKQFKENGGRNVRSFAVANGINEQTFYNWVHRFDKGNFNPSPNPKRKRARESNFPQVEAEILKYIENQERNYVGDKSGLSWLTLQTKASEIANTLLAAEERNNFKASSGWIRNLIRRNNLGIRTPPETAEAPTAVDATAIGVPMTSIVADSSGLLIPMNESAPSFCPSIVSVTDHQLFDVKPNPVENAVQLPQIVYPPHAATD